jgi:hypothetical protein
MAISTATRSQINTRTHSAVHLSELILGAVADIVAALGLNPSQLDVGSVEEAITIWIAEQSLAMLTLECYTPRDDVAHEVFEFPLEYSVSGANTRFSADRSTLALYRAKLKRLPPNCTFRVVVTHVAGASRTQVPGWSATTLKSTEGMQSRVFGTLGSAPDASVSMRYLYRR